MALNGSLISFTALSFWLVILASTPQPAHGSIRGSRSLTNGAVLPAKDGICASAVIIYGYKCQEFEVTTKDGYILSLQRITEGRSGSSKTQRQPVLMQHGVLVEDPFFILFDNNKKGLACEIVVVHQDGMTWLLNPPEENLPLILADEGFDVWIANTRGTRFCRRHISLDPSQRAFWNWSWDELVSYDLPAVVDYVRSQSGQQKIHYVGHSMGTLIALASFAEGQLVDQVKSVALLSPIAYLSHMTTALGVLAARAFMGEITNLLGIAEFNPKGLPVEQFLKILCANPGINCYDLLTSFTGKNCCLNSSTVDLFLKNEPQSTSVKTLVHLSQIVRGRVIAKYNYGNPDYNLMHYGETTPPVYNLSNIPQDLPLFLSYGGRDALSDVVDVDLLLDAFKLHEGDKLQVQYIKDYAHADFVMGVTAKDTVYNQVASFFKRQS